MLQGVSGPGAITATVGDDAASTRHSQQVNTMINSFICLFLYLRCCCRLEGAATWREALQGLRVQGVQGGAYAAQANQLIDQLINHVSVGAVSTRCRVGHTFVLFIVNNK